MSREYKAEQVRACDIGGTDLQQEIREMQRLNRPFLCFLVHSYRDGYQQAVHGEALHALDTDRVGIGWGAEADWCDAESVEDAIEALLAH